MLRAVELTPIPAPLLCLNSIIFLFPVIAIHSISEWIPYILRAKYLVNIKERKKQYTEFSIRCQKHEKLPLPTKRCTFLWSVLWIGILFMSIRIRISIFGADTDPEWHQHDADPHEKTNYFCSQQCQFTMFFFTHQWQEVVIISIFDSILKFLWKKIMCLLPFISTGNLLTAAFKC